MPICGDPLMPASPCRPGQHARHFLLRGEHEAPEETTDFAHTQPHPSPREALNAARLLGVRGDAVFLVPPPAAGGRPAAPSTAHMPPWPASYGDTTLSNSVLHTDPAQPHLTFG